MLQVFKGKKRLDKRILPYISSPVNETKKIVNFIFSMLNLCLVADF